MPGKERTADSCSDVLPSIRRPAVRSPASRPSNCRSVFEQETDPPDAALLVCVNAFHLLPETNDIVSKSFMQTSMNFSQIFMSTGKQKKKKTHTKMTFLTLRVKFYTKAASLNFSIKPRRDMRRISASILFYRSPRRGEAVRSSRARSSPT